MLGAFILIFGVADFFIGRVAAGVSAAPTSAAASAPDQQQIAMLESRATAFNQSVALVASIENGSSSTKSAIFTALTAAATANGVTIARVSAPSPSSPLFLSGSAPSQAQVLAFKTAVEANPQFTSVSLPLANIQSAGGAFSFSMTFGLKTN